MDSPARVPSTPASWTVQEPAASGVAVSASGVTRPSLWNRLTRRAQSPQPQTPAGDDAQRTHSFELSAAATATATPLPRRSLWQRLTRKPAPQADASGLQSAALTPLPSAASVAVGSAVTAPLSVASALEPAAAHHAAAKPSSSSVAGSLESTDWSDISMPKFIGYTVFFSTAENALFYPLFVLKTREQADRQVIARPAAAAGGHPLSAMAQLRARVVEPWHTSMGHLNVILREQGVRKGLYRGFVSSNITAFPAYGVYMGVYSWAKEELSRRSPQPAARADGKFQLSSLYAPFLAGVAADAASIVLYVPGDLIVQRLQLKDSPYSGFLDAIVKIHAADGVRGFFRGFGATFLTSGAASAIWWTFYENIKTKLYEREHAKQQREGAAQSTAAATSSAVAPTTLWGQLTAVNRVPQICAGFVAGTLTSCIINPLDVVKTRLQVQDAAATYGGGATAAANSASGPVPAGAQPVRYRHMAHGMYRIWVDEGFRGYWRGIMPKLLSRGPLSAMSGLLYECVMHLSRAEPVPQPHKSTFD